MRKFICFACPIRRGMMSSLSACALVRCCSTVPTEDEVVRAYKVLGASTSCSYLDVKKKFMELAKKHHPDVAGVPGSGTNAMVDINNAYSTVTQFHKAGRKLSAHHKDGEAGGARQGNASSSEGYYSNGDAKYQPWHEDIDPLLYEMMWEEMRRQNDEDAFARAMNSEAFFRSQEWTRPPPFSGRINNNEYSNRKGYKSQSSGTNAKSQQQQQQQQAKPAKTTTWADSDLKALENMYQDGKSFEFIANALGKSTTEVVAEFNRWSDDSKRRRQGGGGNRHRKKRRPNSYPRGGPYYAESPDDSGFDFSGMDAEMMGAYYGDGDPYGYAAYTEDDFSGAGDACDPYDMFSGAMPYRGTHHMSGGTARGAHDFPQKRKNNYHSNGHNKNKKPFK